MFHTLFLLVVEIKLRGVGVEETTSRFPLEEVPSKTSNGNWELFLPSYYPLCL
jgi:hypothetical protein